MVFEVEIMSFLALEVLYQVQLRDEFQATLSEQK